MSDDALGAACIMDNCDEPRLPHNWRCEKHHQEWMKRRDDSIREHVKRHNVKGYEAKYYSEEDQ